MADANRNDIPRSDPSRSDPNHGDKGRGTWNNVRQTPIYVDSRGRRRRGENGEIEKFPAAADDPTKVLETRVAALEVALLAYKMLNDARTITGGGSVFSGTLGSGIIFNPNAGNNVINAQQLELELCDGSTAIFYVASTTPAP